MFVTLVQVHVIPDYIQEFIAASQANHAASVQEPGNLRFDVQQSPEDPGYFVFYEAYRTGQDAAAHIVAHARSSSMKTNPIVLNDEEISAILEQRCTKGKGNSD